jgi:Ca2+-binding EF-hand superfamily protein
MLLTTRDCIRCNIFHALMWSSVLYCHLVFISQTAAQTPAIEAAFKHRDSDSSGLLSKDEFLAPVDAAQRPSASRDFDVLDWDANGQMSLAKFTTWSALGDISKRGVVPDPITDRAAEKITAVKKDWPQWDTDNNQALSPQEFPAFQAAKLIPGLDTLEFAAWDLDRNGSVEQSEALRVTEAAYGLRRLDGLELRSPRGEVYELMGFTYWDVNGDDRLVAEEMQQRMGMDAMAAAKRIQELDKDADQKLSAEECRSLATKDVLAQFLAWDTNFDGQCDWSELKGVMQPWQQIIGWPVFRAFDENRDSKLSFREYRKTPIVNLVAAWHQIPSDQNGDGELQLTEFRWFPSPFLAALEAEWLNQLDRDHNGSLGLDEFPFLTVKPDGAKTFAGIDVDGDGKLTEDELKCGISYHMRPQRMFLLFDADHDQCLSVTEFRSIPTMEAKEKRQSIPNPLLTLVAEKEQALMAEWKTWDTDQDGQLNRQEFEKAQVGKRIPGLAELDFTMWDLNRNRQLSKETLQRILKTAYGVTRPDGGSILTENGLDTNWMQFKALDRNHDMRLDFIEYSGLGLPQDRAVALFAETDRDHNKFITTMEWSHHSQSYHDPIGIFWQLDADQNGTASREELIAGVQAWQQPVARFIFPGFDTNADGQLSLKEFLLSPLANFQQEWQTARVDVNEDGLLSLAEFRWNQGFDATALTAIFFARLDISRDGKLDPKEYFFTSTRRDTVREFADQDLDHNSQLNIKEFLGKLDSDQSKLAARDFKVFDNNQDGSLTLREYQQIPSRNSLRGRLSPPNPLVELANRLKSTVEGRFKAADKDSNGQLDATEFQLAAVPQLIPGLEKTQLQEWDRNRDSLVSIDEARAVIDAAFGIQRLVGLNYREQSGIVHNVMLYTYADQNHDDQISHAEYLQYGYGGPNALEIFIHADSNHDRRMTFKEFIADPTWDLDPIADFLRFDTDFDSQLSKSELILGTPDWQRPIAKFVFPGFDTDRNGKLSLAEYRVTPMANMIAIWQDPPQDKDGDGAITPQEFYPFPNGQLAGLTREYFRLFDANSDGKLSLDEYGFHFDPGVASALAAFAFYDKDHNKSLTLDEMLKELIAAEKATGSLALDLQIARIEEAFEETDTDKSGELSPTEIDCELGQRVFNPTKPYPKSLAKNPAASPIAMESVAADLSQHFPLMILVNVAMIGTFVWYFFLRRVNARS